MDIETQRSPETSVVPFSQALSIIEHLCFIGSSPKVKGKVIPASERKGLLETYRKVDLPEERQRLVDPIIYQEVSQSEAMQLSSAVVELRDKEKNRRQKGFLTIVSCQTDQEFQALYGEGRTLYFELAKPDLSAQSDQPDSPVHYQPRWRIGIVTGEGKQEREETNSEYYRYINLADDIDNDFHFKDYFELQVSPENPTSVFIILKKPNSEQ